MAVFRVERTTGYTVMSNHHLRNGKQLAGEVSPRREPHRLSDFIKEIHKEQIGGV